MSDDASVVELSKRVERMERRWWLSLVAAAAGGMLVGGHVVQADAPMKELVLADGEQRLELHPWGMKIATAADETTLTAADVTVASLATKRRVALGVSDKNGVAQLAVQSGDNHGASLVVGGYTELELTGDASSVDLRAADEARVAARSDAFTYAEMTAKGVQPCQTLGVKTGTAMRTCNDRK